MPTEELLDIGEFATPNTWQREMIRQDFDPMATTVEALVEFCERQERVENTTENYSKPKGKKMKSEEENIPKKNRNKNPKYCSYCEMTNHNTSDCSHVKRFKRFRDKGEGNNDRQWKKSRYSWKRKDAEKESSDIKKKFSLTKEQINTMVEKAVARQQEKLKVGLKRKAENYAFEKELEELAMPDDFSLGQEIESINSKVEEIDIDDVDEGKESDDSSESSDE